MKKYLAASLAALVLTGLYARTRSVFGATPKGGAVYQAMD